VDVGFFVGIQTTCDITDVFQTQHLAHVRQAEQRGVGRPAMRTSTPSSSNRPAASEPTSVELMLACSRGVGLADTPVVVVETSRTPMTVL
jgi:hypothetical protein